ncbi:MAG: hypothetical protein WKF73_14370 [Nocardioidaceae bacterium]
MRRRSWTALDVGDVFAVELDASGRRLDQPVDHLEGCRLATA